MKKRVVITGMGLVSPIGCSPEAAWKALMEQTCAIAPIDCFDPEGFKVTLAAQVRDFDPEQWLSRREMKTCDRFTIFARAAARQAAEAAGLSLPLAQEMQDGCGICLASGIGGLQTIENNCRTLHEKGPGKISPYFIPMSLINLAAGQTAMDFKAQGSCQSVVTACAAGTNAIGEAFRRIQNGEEDMMIAGGCEASITPLGIAGFQSMRALHTGTDPRRASIPFDAERSGFVMGEGAGILILESLEHAQKRNAPILAEITGYGATCDAHHMTAPDPSGRGAARAMEKALADAGLQPEQIGMIHAHGTSTKLNDSTETKAIEHVFRKRAHQIPVCSTKASTGHLLGASGAVESVFCVEALRHGTVPPTVNYRIPDPECALQVSEKPQPAEDLQAVLKVSLGFGGHNAALVFEKWKGEQA